MQKRAAFPEQVLKLCIQDQFYMLYTARMGTYHQNLQVPRNAMFSKKFWYARA